MLPDRVSNPGPLTYESGALPIALRGPAPGGKINQLGYLTPPGVKISRVEGGQDIPGQLAPGGQAVQGAR